MGWRGGGPVGPSPAAVARWFGRRREWVRGRQSAAPRGEVRRGQWVAPERPPLDGWIPDGWQPADRIQDISPSLPDGYWLDPVKLEKSNARQLLRSRLCAADQTVVEQQNVPGAALAERLYRHCSKEDGFLPSGRLP